MEKWYANSYRRNLIDMHIADWDEVFMSRFNADDYVDALVRAEVDTAIIYASNCLGICFWPTKAGHMHNGLKGRDIIAELLDKCKAKDIRPVLYFNIWSRWAYDTYPEWRMLDAQGRGTTESGILGSRRFGLCCPNTAFKDYVKAQIVDLCTNYECSGLWIDMIGWFGMVCHCPGCRTRYRAETGRELPETVDWRDPDWRAFQQARERWLSEFATMITETAKRIKPQLSVAHQCTTWFYEWAGGATVPFFNQSDYLAGDFYGDAIEQSMICKLLNNMTRNKPVEFMTSRCYDLTDHTTVKPKALLENQIYASIANQTSFVFIDAIDPIGTINPAIYEMMGSIFRLTKPYEKYMDPRTELCADVGIYMNQASLIDMKDNGVGIADAVPGHGHINAIKNIAKTLVHANVPYDALSEKNIVNLDKYQVIILPDMACLGDDEIAAFRQYVQSGGSLYASKHTSRLTDAGIGGFGLEDVFGVSFKGESAENVTYMSPTEAGHSAFPGYSAHNAMMISDTQLRVAAQSGTEVLATLTLPYSDPRDNDRFSSAISNPPGLFTQEPAVVWNRYGQGRAIYAAGSLEAMENEAHRQVFIELLRKLWARPLLFESNAPKSVEITLLRQCEHNRFILNLLNFQKELPNIPVDGIQVRVRLSGKRLRRLYMAPEELDVPYEWDNDEVLIHAPRLDVFQMYVLEYADN